MENPICRTCGVQYPTDVDRDHCPICSDERQYVGWAGQRWTTLSELTAEGHRVEVREERPGLYGVGVTPDLAIGQRALLVPGVGGTVLWDCLDMIDDAGVARVRELGGISAIALSHPHYYGVMVEWSRAFGDVPIYVHARDEQWVPRRDNVVFWEGATREILPGRTLLNLGVHFAGGTVLHWADGVDGRGALCGADIVSVASDRRWVSFMYSFPNQIPEHPDRVRAAVEMLEPHRFAAVYGAWWDRVLVDDGEAAVRRSADRYLRAVGAAPLPVG